MKITVSPYEAREIVKDAYLYGWPMSENYNILHSYALNGNNSEFKAPFNEIHNVARLYGPEDTAIVTPNSDTPYSFIWADLRVEPVVITIPKIPEPEVPERYFSFQLIDLYTHNFEYIGTRMGHENGGSFVIVGPSWQGPYPSDDGIVEVFQSETDFIFSITRTQLIDSEDMPSVEAIQSEYQVQTLSQYRGAGSPPAAPDIDWPAPLPREQGETVAVFRNINFLLQFCPTHPSEERLMERFAQISVGAGLPFDPDALEPDMLKAFEGGIADAWEEFEKTNQCVADGTLDNGYFFGTREYLETYSPDNYLYRFAGAKNGLYGNSKEEAFYPFYYTDSEGAVLDCSDGRRYEIRLEESLPAEAFASITMYDGESQLLVANEIDRYLVNSAMLESFKPDADGTSITIYIQNESLENTDKAPNWLPAPSGPFYLAMRLYLPEEHVYATGSEWTPPPVQLVTAS